MKDRRRRQSYNHMYIGLLLYGFFGTQKTCIECTNTSWCTKSVLHTIIALPGNKHDWRGPWVRSFFTKNVPPAVPYTDEIKKMTTNALPNPTPCFCQHLTCFNIRLPCSYKSDGKPILLCSRTRIHTLPHCPPTFVPACIRRSALRLQSRVERASIQRNT